MLAIKHIVVKSPSISTGEVVLRVRTQIVDDVIVKRFSVAAGALINQVTGQIGRELVLGRDVNGVVVNRDAAAVAAKGENVALIVLADVVANNDPGIRWAGGILPEMKSIRRRR